jgi:hypothetical protein
MQLHDWIPLRVEQSRLEICRIRREISEWLDRRRKADTLRQFETQLNAIEAVLMKALAGITAELGLAGTSLSAFEACQRVDRGGVWVRRVWSFFRSRFDQRDDRTLGPVLAAADELVWSCYVEPFRSAGRSHAAVPIAYVEDRYSPSAIPRVDPPPDLKSDVDAAFLTSFMRTLPIPVVAVPPVCVEEPWWLVFIAHEAGHHVEYDLAAPGLVDAFEKWIDDVLSAHASIDGDTRSRWKRWAKEVFADAWSVLATGPAALWALIELEAGSEAKMLRVHPAYPSPLVRCGLLAKFLQALGVDATAALRGLDPSAAQDGVPLIDDKGVDLRARLTQDLEGCGPLAEALMNREIVSGLTLPALASWDASVFAPWGAVSEWSQMLTAADDPPPEPTLEAARRITSAAVWAWADTGKLAPNARAARRELLRKRMLATVAASREEGTRAAPPRKDFDTDDAGLQLASLVLTHAPDVTGGEAT